MESSRSSRAVKTAADEFHPVTRDRPCEICQHTRWCRRSDSGGHECHRCTDLTVGPYRRVAVTPGGFGVYRLANENGNGQNCAAPSRPKAKVTRLHRTVEEAAQAAARKAGGELAALYRYSDDFYRARIALPDGDKTFRPIVKRRVGWGTRAPERPWPLYRAAELPATGRVYVCEGEKATDACWSVGLPAVTSGPSDSAGLADWSPLAGRDMMILPDRDDAGEKYAAAVAEQLARLDPPARVSVLRLPGLQHSEDAHEFINVYRECVEPEAIRAEIEAMPTEAPPANATDPRAYLLTDYGNAERLVAAHGHDLRHCEALGWLAWDDIRWRIDDTGEVVRRAKSTIRALWPEVGACDEGFRDKLVKHLLESEKAGRLAAMVKLAESERPVVVRIEALDADPWLFNVANGMLDLRTGALRPHDRHLLCTKVGPVAFTPEAPAPAWDRFLLEIFDNNDELVGFARRAVGSALVGEVREHKLHILYGSGANGKSTFLSALAHVFGDYGMAAPPGLLMQDQEDKTHDLADLRGVRLVTASETGERKRLAEERVKTLTGGDTIRARHLYQRYFSFRPSHTLFLATNHRPVIIGTDLAVWRRIALWPFTVSIPPEAQDRELGEKLRAEAPGILAWAVRGCLEWQRAGYDCGECAAVSAATDEYRSDSDVFGQWLSECCVTDRRYEVGQKMLYESYSAWCNAAGHRPASVTTFGGWLRERGYERRRSHGRTFYVGLDLLAGAGGAG